MALTVNTMLPDSDSANFIKEQRKKQIAANEALWDRGVSLGNEAAIKRYEDALAENDRRAQAGTDRAAAVNAANAATPPADPTKDAAVTPPSNYNPNSGYVGGGSGSASGGTSTPTTPAPEATPYAYNGWKAPTLSPATDMSEKINALYKTQEEAALKALEDAYTQSIAGIDANAAKIPDYYYEAQRMQQGADARAQQATNEYFAARGLNTGTAGQAQLAQRAVNLQNTADINRAEADALADVEADRTAAMLDYQAQVRQAILNNEMEKAAALYEEAMRVDQSITDTAIKQAELDYKQYQLERADAEARAQMLASMGDFSGYKALGYTDAEVAAMQGYYNAANTPVYSGGGTPPTTPPTEPTQTELPLESIRAREVYSALTKGTISTQDAGYILQTYLDIGAISADEALYIGAKFGFA